MKGTPVRIAVMMGFRNQLGKDRVGIDVWSRRVLETSEGPPLRSVRMCGLLS